MESLLSVLLGIINALMYRAASLVYEMVDDKKTCPMHWH